MNTRGCFTLGHSSRGLFSRLSVPIQAGIVYGCLLLVLAAIIFPVFATAKHGSGRSCMSNLKNIANAMREYSEDYDEHLPRAEAWIDQTLIYSRSPQIYCCSGFARQPNREETYAYNSLLSDKCADALPNASVTPLCYDTRLPYHNAHAPGRSGLAVPPRHGGINCMAYLDGHVGQVDAQGRTLNPSDMQPAKQTPLRKKK